MKKINKWSVRDVITTVLLSAVLMPNRETAFPR